jgi:putative ABC transport system ATP-binding protein
VTRSSEIVLRVRDVACSRPSASGPTTVLAPISFDIRAGRLTVLAGPSGSGKTTLCNVLIGWDLPDAGVVEWAPPRRSVAGWARVAAVPQRLALLEHLSVWENVAVTLWVTDRTGVAARLERVAERLDIAHLLDRLPGELSLGEQQRVAVARAIAVEPVLAVLDEPTGHQDERRTAAVLDSLLEARAGGTAVVVATHDDEVIAVADEVVRVEVPVAAAGWPHAR